MSHVRRQGTDNDRQFSGPPRPPTGRNETPAYTALSGNLIPRDYLGYRPDEQNTRLGPFPEASPLKPAPSRLHTNLPPQSFHQDDLDSPKMSSSPSSVNPSPFRTSPSTNQIAHVSFPTPPSHTGHSPYSSPETTGKRPLDGINQDERAMTESPNYKSSLKASDTADFNQPTTASCPISAGSSLQSMPAHRLGQRAMPRTSSIDSAISSLSSVAQSQKSSFDANALSAADIENLIATAGSAEAVIIHLLKEKHHAASQNSQLWRLVDKQRTLIFGLNKDLERALKEKEKYKRKVKDLQDSAPPLVMTDTQASQRRASEGGDVPGYRGTIKQDQPEGRLISAENAKDFELGTTLDARDPAGSSEFQNTLGIPVSDNKFFPSASDKNKIPPPNRKPPPAPLNLQPAGHSMEGSHRPYDSESEYEDISEVDEVLVERGRRKTREEDDRERGAPLESDRRNSGEFEEKNNPSESSDHPGSIREIVKPTRLESRPVTAQFSPVVEQSESAAPFLDSRMTRGASVNERRTISAPKSPGLPLSPRPEDRPFGSPLPRMPREVANSLASTQMSAGNNTSGPGVSSRVTKNQMPGNPISLASSNDALHVPFSNQPISSVDNIVTKNGPEPAHLSNRGIYRGFVSENYPNFLLPPNALPLVQVKVSSSRLRPSRNSYMASRPYDEEPVFTLGIFSRSGNSELWRVEKAIAALPQLDQQIRQLSGFSGKLPDRAVFSGNSPAKVDTRRAALNAYFGDLLDTPMDEKAASVVCQFLTSDAIEPRDDETSLLNSGSHDRPEILRGPDGKPRREGYLTKRGKNFGGWKARYFVLHGPEFKYFESPGGPHMGTIKINHAQIGKQSEKIRSQASPSRADDESENQYRHAFLILEPKKKDSSALVRHVLCAESDEERDAWVEALLEYVDTHPSENEGSKGKAQVQENLATGTATGPKSFSIGNKRSGKGIDNADLDPPDTVQGFSYDDAVAAEPPILGPSYEKAPLKSSHTAPCSLESAKSSQVLNPSIEQGQVPSYPIISGPTNGAVIQDAGAWGNKAVTTKEKKRSIWGFRTRSSFDLASQVQPSNDSPTTQGNSALTDRRDIVKSVFGMPLEEAVLFCAPQGVDVDLPAVVYRSIEYLEAKGAASEEGIFRLSGSNVVVKALKERFNTEGDVDLLGGDQYYDVHAVASLFKQYLRELPTTVLTRELHLEFLRVLELDERQKKVVAFNGLVHRLPKPNLALLRALSKYLIVIVNNSNVNKMTVRNVGIVFAPTLNIPAPVFSMFLTDFDSIFGEPADSSAQTLEVTAGRSLSPQDIRSPRRQMFSDIPTPAYNQTSFRMQDNMGDAVPEEDYVARHPTGFISMQPSYEQPYRTEGQNLANSASFNRMLAPNSETARSKAKRRESSLLFMEADDHASSISPSSNDQSEHCHMTG
ncbi:GTPase-activating protein [Aspergillus sclerotialis]|uniref:GTPase-activating protein n=1 Tax=Aspergillus sclerotialis TaxID=2070753 RepID=A0A3A3A4D7_9EURO|nr:GTPase-activating protein [Aspergillus sclerotialis]